MVRVSALLFVAILATPAGAAIPSGCTPGPDGTCNFVSGDEGIYAIELTARDGAMKRLQQGATISVNDRACPVAKRPNGQGGVVCYAHLLGAISYRLDADLPGGDIAGMQLEFKVRPETSTNGQPILPP